MFIIDAVNTTGTYVAGNGTVVSVVGSSSVLADMSANGDEDDGSTNFEVESDKTARVTLTVFVTADTDPSALYEVALTSIEYNDTDDTVTPVEYTFNLDDFETESALSLRHTN